MDRAGGNMHSNLLASSEDTGKSVSSPTVDARSIDAVLKAAESGDRDTLAKFVDKHGPDSLLQCRHNFQGKSVLHLAVAGNHTAIVDFLFRESVRFPVDDLTHDKETPLFFVTSFEVAHALLEQGASVNARDANKNTPLHAAAGRCNPAVIIQLLEKNASAYAKNAEGQSAMATAKAKVDSLQVVVTSGGSGATAEAQSQLEEAEKVVMVLKKFQ
jgi:ankyrin repeat protein